jgi:hypothetical protein
MRLRVQRGWGWAVLVVFVVATFLLVGAWRLNMHPDEELSYRSTNGDLAFTINFQTSVQDNQAPLWFVTFWAWRETVGDAEYTSRVLGVLCVLLALAITYRLGRRWFGSKSVGLAAPLLLIGNGLFFNYALDIRPYPLVMLCAALSMWAYTRWLDGRSPRRAAIYGVSIALLLYVHYLLVFLVIVQGVYFLTQKPRPRDFGQAALAGIVGVGLWLPWLPTFYHQVIGLRQIETASGTGRGVAGIGVSTQATSLQTALDLINAASNGLIWLYGLVLIVGVVWVVWQRARRRASVQPHPRPFSYGEGRQEVSEITPPLVRTGEGQFPGSYRYGLALAWGIGVALVALAANLVAAVYAPRFVSHMMLGLALALAAGLIALPRRFGYVGVAIIIGANLLTFSGTIPDRVPYRDLYGEISAQGQPGDVVLNTGNVDGFLAWQQAHYLSPELQAGITGDVETAQAARRVWFLTGDWFNPAIQAQFASLEPTHPVQEVLGQCPERGWCYLAQLMEAPPLDAPVRFGAANGVDFWGAGVDAVTASEVETRLWWRVEEAPSVNYSFSLRLVDGAGAVIAQSDGPIHHYGADVETSALEPGKISIDSRNIALPQGLARGEYRLELVVYQSWDGVRLAVNGADSLDLGQVEIS